MSILSSKEMVGLRVIEDEVNQYLSGRPTNPENCIGINSALNRIIPKTLMPTKKVHIVWNKTARNPFIMSMTPDISELYQKSEKINTIMNDPKSSNSDLIKEWADITEWYLEIDTRVLTMGDRLCVDDGAQFVALLCHEIGHVMNENPMNLISNYKKQSARFSTMEKLMLSNSKIVRAIMLPMYCHTLQFMIVVKDRNDNRQCEAAADRYVPDEYKGALVSYMNNHLLLEPKTSSLIVDQTDFEKEQEVGIGLSRDSIEMLKGRRDVLNRQIQNQYNSQDNGVFHKKLMQFIGRNLTGYSPEDEAYIAGLKTMMENAYNREYSVMESKAEQILTESAKISQRDIDVLTVQIESIKTPEDKMYFIHKIYDYMEALEREARKNKKPYDPRMEKLSNIRDKIMSIKVSEVGSKYGVFVKYPEGYEG